MCSLYNWRKKQSKVYLFKVCASDIVYQLLVCCPECNLNDGSPRNLLRHVSVLAIFVVNMHFETYL